MAAKDIQALVMDVSAVVRGREARIYHKYPDGRRFHMGNYISFEAKQDASKTAVPILNNRSGAGNIKGVPKNTISGTRHFNNSIHRKYLLEYKNTGKDLYYDVIIINDDPSSTVGKQEIILYGVNDDSVTLAKFDAGAEYLTEDMSATFEDWNMDSEFNNNAITQA